MITEQQLIEVGFIAKLHGLKGEMQARITDSVIVPPAATDSGSSSRDTASSRIDPHQSPAGNRAASASAAVAATVTGTLTRIHVPARSSITSTAPYSFPSARYFTLIT